MACLNIVTSVTSRLDPYTVDDIEALLLAQEERFEKHKKAYSNLILANTASGPSYSSGRGRGDNSNFRGEYNNRSGRSNFRGGYNSNRGGRYNNGRGNDRSNKDKIQIILGIRTIDYNVKFAVNLDT